MSFEERQNKRKEGNIIYAYKDTNYYYYAFGKVVDHDLDKTIKFYMYWFYKVDPICELVMGGPYEYDGKFAVMYRSKEEINFTLFSVQIRWVDSLEEIKKYRDIE